MNHLNADSLLDAELNKPNSSAHLDSIVANFPSDELIDGGIRGGAIEAFKMGKGRQKSGVGVYIPGIHRHRDIIPSSIANDDSPILARNPRTNVVPFNTHLILDRPKRTESFLGEYRYRNIANYVLALTRHVANTSGSDLSIYYRDDQSAGLIFDGESTDAYLAEGRIEGNLSENLENDEILTFAGLLEEATPRIDPSNDAVFIVSDFQGEFDDDKSKFEWEDNLLSLNSNLNDRLWSTRVRSPSQQQVNFGLTEDFDIDDIFEINERSVQKVANREEKFQAIEKNLNRHLTINTAKKLNNTHPVTALTEFILGVRS